RGLVSAARSLWKDNQGDPPVLEGRVRSRIGRAVSHPHAITVRAQAGGRITLEGLVLEHEQDYLLKSVRAVPAVRDVINRLRALPEHNNVPGLQGGVPRTARPELFQEEWTPALRIGAGALGGAGVLSAVGLGGGKLRV